MPNFRRDSLNLWKIAFFSKKIVIFSQKLTRNCHFFSKITIFSKKFFNYHSDSLLGKNANFQSISVTSFHDIKKIPAHSNVYNASYFDIFSLVDPPKIFFNAFYMLHIYIFIKVLWYILYISSFNTKLLTVLKLHAIYVKISNFRLRKK